MKVSELIKELMSFEAAHGDLPVKIITDHGQVHFEANDVQLAATENKKEWMSEPLCLSEVEEFDGDEVCQIQ